MELTPRPFENKAILVVEDDDDLCRDIVDKLKKSGARVIGPAASALDALLFLEHGKVDAVLIDIHVDTDSAIPIAKKLLDEDVPFVFATSQNCSDLPDDYRGFLVDRLSDLQLIANVLFPPH